MAGTLAALAAAGHRVLLVTATAGEHGLADPAYGSGVELAGHRTAELGDAAAALGCTRSEVLGWADSGMDGDASGERGFARADVEGAAARLATLLRAEHADVLTIYDPAGGYGHPDHLQVHRVGVRAAELAGTPLVLEATIDRRVLLAATAWIPRLPGGARRASLARAFADPARLTHRLDVRAQAGAKRAAMAAHRSQLRPGRRTLRLLLLLPRPLFRVALGREWIVVRTGGDAAVLSDVLAAIPAKVLSPAAPTGARGPDSGVLR
ncbi:PIG-L family deacetylase [Cellulomonas sp. McL0617]|uniref:PIG-L family deacetylase n=1 Tax=Cellulomonas sp. McL0617 TaxID=3415675 RepID=UPI003CF86746